MKAHTPTAQVEWAADRSPQVGALRSLVFATGRFDPLNFAVAAAVLMVVGAVAVLPAARRAARTEPLSALRSE